MEFRTLKYVEAVARTGSVRAAAEKLHIAGSALSRTIALFEARFGTPLFDRTPRGMIPTAAGEIFLRYARGVMLDQERLRGELDELKGVRRGHIRVFSIEGVVGDFVVASFVEFRRSRPGVTLELHVSGSDLVRDALCKREADLGVAATPINASVTASGTETVLRIPTPLLAVMAPVDAPPEASEMSLAEAAERFQIAMPDETFAIRRQLDQCADVSGLTLTPALVTNSVDALRSFARLGAGVIFLPFLAVREDIERDRLVGIPLSDAILKQATIEVMVASDRALSPASAEFLRFLETVARKLAEAHGVKCATSSRRQC